MADSNDQNELARRIRREVSIVDVIGENVRVERREQSLFCECPLHVNSRSLLQIDPERNLWRCWVCDQHGDSITFLMAYQDTDFKAAVQLLARRLEDS